MLLFLRVLQLPVRFSASLLFSSACSLSFLPPLFSPLMSAAVTSRLEAVAARLEAYVSTLGGAAASGSASGSSGASSAKVDAYDAFVASAAQPFIEAANATEGSKAVVRQHAQQTAGTGGQRICQSRAL